MRRFHRSVNEIRALFKYCTNVMPVGSRATCIPIPTDTDEDWLILIKPNNIVDTHGTLIDAGFELGGSIMMDDKESQSEIAFRSYTRGELNLIVTEKDDFYIKFLKATAISTKLNLLDKKDRIMLFQAILYDNW